MAHIQSRFTRRKGVSNEIPTGSMADISFLLIIFFMVTTTFVVYRGFPVNLPFAERIDASAGKRNTVTVWVGANGRIMVDEYDVKPGGVGKIVAEKLAVNPRVVVTVKADRDTEYRMISGVIAELRDAGALRVSFVAREEGSVPGR